MIKVAPLSSGYMLVSMFGFIASLIVIMPLSREWGFAFAFIFAIMFIASLISMTYAPSLKSLEITFGKKKKK
jgi:hypothetical protein